MTTPTSPTSRFSSKVMLISAALLVIVIAVVLSLMSVRRERPDPGASPAYRYMRSDLEGLMAAEAFTHRQTGKYVNDPVAAGAMSTFGVEPPVVTLDGDGWYATVTSTKVRGGRCAVAVDARNPIRKAAKSGEIACE